MNSRLLGALGEQAAAQLLRKKGYTITAANFRTAAGEIDIVAENAKYLCIVEVKTRRTGGYLPPEAAVDRHKQQNLHATAAAFLQRRPTRKTLRFDIIEVYIEDEEIAQIHHIENAFA